MALGFQEMIKSDSKSKQENSAGDKDSDGETYDTSRRGLKQIDDSNQITLDIKVHLVRIIKEFERSAAIALGLKPGMP